MIRRLRHNMKQILGYVLAGAFIIIVVLVFSSLLKDEPNGEGPPLQVQRVEDPEHAADEYQIVVPEERIPETMDERMTSAPIALLPNHAGFPEARGEVALPESERAALGRDLERALSVWETFTPSDGFRDRYRGRIEPFVVPDTLPTVVDRRDSNDAPGVCPETSCRLGSKWYRPGAISWFLIDSDADQVYIVAYGAVLYRGDDSDPRSSSSSERSYGVVMRKVEGRWLLERVAAESLR